MHDDYALLGRCKSNHVLAHPLAIASNERPTLSRESEITHRSGFLGHVRY